MAAPVNPRAAPADLSAICGPLPNPPAEDGFFPRIILNHIAHWNDVSATGRVNDSRHLSEVSFC
jgi:hypothetical protein